MPPRTKRPFLQFFETHTNDLSDSDAEWWPFLSLRCAPHQRMTVLRTLLLAVAYAAPAALLAVVLGTVLGEPIEPSQLLLFLPASILGVFLMLQISVAYSWNRRAVRLQARAPIAQRAPAPRRGRRRRR